MKIPTTSQSMLDKLIHIMAKGTLAFHKKHNIPLPRTYEEFENGVVNFSRETDLKGGIAFEDPEAGDEAVRLFSEPLGIPSELIDLPLEELDKRIKQDPGLKRKFDLLTDLLRGNINSKGTAFKELGEQFAPITYAFKNKICYRKSVFEAMQKMIQEQQ